MARANLEKFIKEQFSDPVKGPCTGITLIHMVHNQPKEIDTIQIKPEGNSYDPQALAMRFRNKAESYSAEIPGVQMFQLAAFFGDSKEPQAWQPFSVTVQADMSSGLFSEPPTEAGRFQQLMRQTEASFGQMFRKQQHLDEMHMRMFELLTNDNASLRRDNMEGFSIVKDLLMERSLNEHQRTMEQLTYSRQTDERKKWLGFLPLVINTILGDEVFPQSSEDTVLVESIANNLSPEHIQKLMGLDLPNEIMGPLAGRVMKAKEKAAKQQTAIKQLPRSNMKGEDDVTGGAEE